MSQELYEQPRQEFSQGDIVDVAPHIFLDPPLLAMRPSGNNVYHAEPEPFTMFDDVNGQPVLGRSKRAKAIVLTHDCEIDKPKVVRWHLSPILPLSKLKQENQDLVKRNRIYSMFFLPRYGEVIADSFVDLSFISTVGMDFIKTGKRILSLSDFGRQGLYAQLFRWLTRFEMRELDCPNCGVKFTPLDSVTR